MAKKTEITGNYPQRGLKDIEGFYSIIKNNVHLFISNRYEPPFNIDQLQCKGRSHELDCQFIKCRTISLESDFDEFLVKDAYIGENELSFKNNLYRKCIFYITNDFSAFFDSPWNSLNSMNNSGIQTINFKSRENRTIPVQIDENTLFTISVGYSQSYSKIRYEAHSSLQLKLEFHTAVSREHIFKIVNSIIDFYSLFCQKRLALWQILMEFEQDKYVSYYGEKLSETQPDYFGNLLVEAYQLKETVESKLAAWISNYEKNKIAIDLFKDAQDLKDEQLKFICLMRCLEIFHRENFVKNKIANKYLDELHQFITEHSLSDIDLQQFKMNKEITLSHRIYDLTRSVFDLIKKDKLMFGYITNTNRCQQLADTRNYYQHFSESSKKKAWNLETLPHINFELQTFVRILFLKQFGFTNDTMESVIDSIKGKYFF